jgi:MarR family transcriptional regulator, negative regulator of the multidrug operon emrRAB
MPPRDCERRSATIASLRSLRTPHAQLRRGVDLGRGPVQRLGNSGDQLRGREGLGQHDAVGNALGSPVFNAVAAHIDHRKRRIGLPSMPGHLPALQLVAAEIDVGYERAVFALGAVEQFDGVLTQALTISKPPSLRASSTTREVIGRGGETPAALVVIGYGQGMTNDKLRRILGLSHSGTVRLVDRLVSDQLVERRPGQDGREVALYLTAKGAAARKDLMASWISAVASLLDVLSPAETKRLGTLIRELLARQDTSELDRFTICRMCDDRVCTNCPLPTTKSKRDR